MILIAEISLFYLRNTLHHWRPDHDMNYSSPDKAKNAQPTPRSAARSQLALQTRRKSSIQIPCAQWAMCLQAGLGVGNISLWSEI